MNEQPLQPLNIIDDRTPEQLRADGDDRWPDGTPYTTGGVKQLALKQELAPVLYQSNRYCKEESYYRGVTSDVRVLFVLADVLHASGDALTAEVLHDADTWLASVDEESVWFAAVCEACGNEYRPCDGYYEAGEYSYCAECCHW